MPAKSFPSIRAADPATKMPAFETLSAYETAVAAIPGLKLWCSPWRSDMRTIVGGKCSQLTDRTGLNNHLVQATDANRPVLDDDFFGTVDGGKVGAILTDGATDLYMETAANVFDGTGIWSVFVVFRPAGTTGDIINNTGNFRFRMNSATDIRIFSPACSLVVPNMTGITQRAFAKQNYPGAGTMVQTVRDNGLVSTNPAATGANVTANKVRIGLSAPGSNRINAAYGEIIVASSDFTTQTMDLLENYAKFVFDAR